MVMYRNRTDLFRHLGLTSAYMHVEDVEFRIRLIERGHSFRFVEGAAVCHPWRRRAAKKEAARYRESVETFARLRPDMSPRFGLGPMLQNAAREVANEILPGLLRFRGAGFFNAVSYHFFMIFYAVLPRFVRQRELAAVPSPERSVAPN